MAKEEEKKEEGEGGGEARGRTDRCRANPRRRQDGGQTRCHYSIRRTSHDGGEEARGTGTRAAARCREADEPNSLSATLSTWRRSSKSW